MTRSAATTECQFSRLFRCLGNAWDHSEWPAWPNNDRKIFPHTSRWCQTGVKSMGSLRGQSSGRWRWCCFSCRVLPRMVLFQTEDESALMLTRVNSIVSRAGCERLLLVELSRCGGVSPRLNNGSFGSDMLLRFVGHLWQIVPSLNCWNCDSRNRLSY